MLRLGPDGALIRDQQIPQAETVAIGEDFLTVTRDGSGPNLLPLPEEMRPRIALLRTVATGDPAALIDDFEVGLTADTSGWQVDLRSADSDLPPMRVTGCGSRLRTVEITGTDGVLRRMILGTH